MTDRLAEDHRNARRLADGIAGIPGLRIDQEAVQTNILYADLDAPGIPCEGFLKALRSRGLLASATGPKRFRMVTHYGIGAADIDAALGILQEVLATEAGTV
jgi:threonine aldolase